MKLRFLTLSVLLSLAFASAQGDANSVLERVLGNLRGESQVATLELRVIRPGEEDTFTMRIFSEGEFKGLTRVIAPPRDAGQPFLNDGDNVFIYNPRLRRVLRLPPSGRSDSFLGSDISYSDLAGDDLRESYSAKILAENDESVTLELVPDPNAPTLTARSTLQPENPRTRRRTSPISTSAARRLKRTSCRTTLRWTGSTSRNVLK